MKIFITGASGFVGQYLVKELLAHNYEVVALARNAAASSLLQAAGVEILTGSLEDHSVLANGARSADGIIHLAFVRDFSPEGLAKSLAIDRAAIDTMASAIANSNKPLVVTSGTLAYPKGVLSTEDSEPERQGPLSARQKSADLLFLLAQEKNFRGILVRLPPTHGKGDTGFLPILVNKARENGFATIIGDGSARWSAVHVEDAAVGFRLVLEKGVKGATYHFVAEEGIAMNDINGLIGRKLGVSVESKEGDDAVKALGGPVAYLIGCDNPTSSERTRKELGWVLGKVGLLEDMEENYFQ